MRFKMSANLLEISWPSYKESRGSFRRWTQASSQSYIYGREEFFHTIAFLLLLMLVFLSWKR